MARRKDHPYRAIFREDQFGWASVDEDAYGAGYVGAIHKRKHPDRPYRFPNEFICGHLAHYILLPCPPFAITYFDSQEGVEIKQSSLFSSLDFDFERDSFPPPDFDACYREMPELCAGILAFDIFVANPDRRRGNIWCDDTLTPTKILIFDHDIALFRWQDDGALRMAATSDLLGLDIATTADNYHPFLKKIESCHWFDQWFNRIASIPKWFISQIVRDAEQYGLTRTESNWANDILTYRSRNLETIILKNRTQFSGIHDWERKGLLK
jgi:hypothetical protein